MEALPAEALKYNLNTWEGLLGLSWQHSVQTDMRLCCSSMIALYKLSQHKPSVFLSLLHRSCTVKWAEIPQHNLLVLITFVSAICEWIVRSPSVVYTSLWTICCENLLHAAGLWIFLWQSKRCDFMYVPRRLAFSTTQNFHRAPLIKHDLKSARIIQEASFHV